ncbi:MAG: PH domain-containing protein [Bifidobacteriaceae bacterium]|nr:PH domain-containing protein [Bifidobacteriaceae bacterium]
MSATPFRFRAATGPWLAGTVIVLCVGAAVDLAVEGGPAQALRWAPTAGFVAMFAWAVFWAPEVTVHDAGPTVRNILRTWVVPWQAIQAIDTKYSLTLITPGRRIAAFAAPAPGRATVRRAVRSDLDHLPDSTFGPGRSVRPGDLPASPSGQLAVVLRSKLEELRDAGQMEPGQPAAIQVLWHRTTMLLLAGLAGLAVLAAALIH